MVRSDSILKICIFGDGGVGKTSLINRFAKDFFDMGSELTKGIDFQTKKIEIDGAGTYTLQLWDFGGQDEFHFLLPEYIEGASGAIYMYDITRFSSIKHLDTWLKKLSESNYENVQDMPILLVGGKLDLAHRRSVPLETPSKLGDEFNIIKTMECSSKTGENVEDVFITLTQEIVKKRK